VLGAGRTSPRVAAAAAWMLLLGIGAYRAAVAPLLVGACRFTPSCSQYAVEAIWRFGPWRGLGLALRRLARCHPLQAGGWDPVPEVWPHR
jgi:putative membrane protein insertion efficiency factor